MKKITKSIVAAFAIATTLVSCTKDNPSSSSVAGNWNLDNIVLTTPNKTPQTIDADGDCTVKNYFNLQTGGVFEEGDVDTDTCELTKSPGTWTKASNSVEITVDGDTQAFDIKLTTASKLVLRITDLGSDAPAGSYADFNFSKK